MQAPWFKLTSACSSAILVGTCLAALIPAACKMSTPKRVAKHPQGPAHVTIRQRPLEVVIADNRGSDDETLDGHDPAYSGLAILRHVAQPTNVFVQKYAGLNFEHIHNGRTARRRVLFEPRVAAMRLSQPEADTALLEQPSTPFWQLESQMRYRVLDDGVVEMTVTCTPRADTFEGGYIGLFFASYVQAPESTAIHFIGVPASDPHAVPGWVDASSPEHGVRATHRSVDDDRVFPHDPDFPLSLVFSFSEHRFTESWYYGVSHGMALVYVFRKRDRVRFTQSPSGGGEGNPAWDFQWFIPEAVVGQPSQFAMRLLYVPFESREQIAALARRHAGELDRE